MTKNTTPHRKKLQQSHRKAVKQFNVRAWVPVIFLVLATAAVFSPVFFAEFTSWDDNLNVSKNPYLNPPTLSTVAWFWQHPYLDLYIPVTYTAWGILAAMAQLPQPDTKGLLLEPAVFHIANLVMHVGAALITYLLLRKLFKHKWAALAGALLFAIHPIQVEAVAWVTGMKDVLCGELSLLALWQYVCFADAENVASNVKKRRMHYAAALVAFVLAILSKPSAATVPLAAMVIDAWVLRRAWRRVLIGVAPMVVISVVLALFATNVQKVVPADGGHAALRPLIALDAIAFYLYKLIFPLQLGFHYDHAPLTVIHGGWLYFTWIAPAAIAAIAILFRKRWFWILPACALFLMSVAPVLGLIPFAFQRYSTVADRYLYMSMLGPAMALAALLSRWNPVKNIQRDEYVTPMFPRPLIVALSIIFLALGLRSVMQACVWHDNMSLFTHGLAVNAHSAAACDGIAGQLASDKRIDEAMPYAERAIELSPEGADGYITLGTLCNMRGDLKRATAQFRKAVECSPDGPEALNSLGAALAQQGKFDEAETLLRHAIERKPEMEPAHLNLAMLLFQTSRRDEALAQARLAARLDAADAQAHFFYARCLLNVLKDRQGAIEQLRLTLQINPELAEARNAYNMLGGSSP